MRIVLPSVNNIEYLPHFKDTIKNLGGEWDYSDNLWVLPKDTVLPDDLKQYVWDR